MGGFLANHVSATSPANCPACLGATVFGKSRVYYLAVTCLAVDQQARSPESRADPEPPPVACRGWLPRFYLTTKERLWPKSK